MSSIPPAAMVIARLRVVWSCIFFGLEYGTHGQIM
jgi:hypothetical protein